MKGKSLRKHSLHEKTAALVLINLDIDIMYIIYHSLYISFTVLVHYMLLTVYMVYCVYIFSALRLRRKIKYQDINIKSINSSIKLIHINSKR